MKSKLASVLASGALACVLAACDDAAASAHAEPSIARQDAGPVGAGAGPGTAVVPSAENPHASCEARIAELTAELRRERDLRLEREREWLRYTQRMARLMELAGAPRFQPEVPASEREERALQSDPRAPASVSGAAEVASTSPSASPAPGPAVAAPAPSADAQLLRVARLAHEERSRAVFLALRSLFAVEHISGLDLLESGSVANGATGPVVLRVIDDRGRPLGSLYAERLRLEGSHAARTLTLVLEQGWDRRSGTRTPFEGGPADAEGRGGVRRIELAHVDPTPWFEALPELFREDQRQAVTQGDPKELTALRFELNTLFRADASGPVYRLESLTAKEGLVLREVRLSVLTPDLLLERELFADRMAILRAEKGLEIVLESGSQIRGSEKVPFLEGRYRIFLPRADAARWEAAGIPLGRRAEPAAPASAPPAAVPAAVPATPGG
ncbi:MAG: hypothetical protein NTY35_12095 [Planctomycetota bacterium]|nr:hypothetical protein [Planctomycetota bacterium]